MRLVQMAFTFTGLVLSGMAIVTTGSAALAAGAGPLNTPLSAFVGGTGNPAKLVWIVPGVIKKDNMSTDFLCTSLEAPGVDVDIGVEVFALDGTQLNKIDGRITTGVAGPCTTGAMVKVPSGSTVTIGIAGSAQFHEDCIIGITAAVGQGSARIVSTSSRISCDAIALDDKHVVVAPNTCSTCQPPPMTSLKVVRPKKQVGD